MVTPCEIDIVPVMTYHLITYAVTSNLLGQAYAGSNFENLEYIPFSWIHK